MAMMLLLLLLVYRIKLYNIICTSYNQPVYLLP